MFGLRDRMSHDTRRQQAGFEDGFAVRGRIPAVDAAAREIDHGVATVQLLRPGAEGCTVPLNDGPWTRLRVPAENDDVMTVQLKCACKSRPDLPRSARNDDLHGTIAKLRGRKSIPAVSAEPRRQTPSAAQAALIFIRPNTAWTRARRIAASKGLII